MPRAPDLETLLDIEAQVETAFGDYFTNTLSVPVEKSDSNMVVETPRIEIVASVIEQGEHQLIVSSGYYAGRTLYDQFRVGLSLKLVYDPTAAQSPGVLRGKLRKALTDYLGIQAKFDAVGYLLLASDSFRQTGGGREINEGEDVAEINTLLEPIFFLNPHAVPITTASP